MASDGWVAVADEGGSARSMAEVLASEIKVPGLSLTKAKVLARALVIGLEELASDHARLMSPARPRTKRTKSPSA